MLCMKKVLIVGSSKQPIPAVKGGAVPALVEELITQNEAASQIDLSCISIYDAEAVSSSRKYTKTNFIWAKVPRFIKSIDRVFYYFAKYVLAGWRIHSLSFVAQILWFSLFVAKNLRRGAYDAVIFENSLLVMHSLRFYGNWKKYEGKWFLHMHTVPRSYYGIGNLVEKSKKIIVVSNYVKQEVQKKLHLSESQFVVMYNCLQDYFFVEPTAKDIDDIRRTYLKNFIGKKVVLFAGRLNEEKGIEQVISAIKLLDRGDLVLLIVGSNFYKSNIVGRYEARLKALTQSIKNKIVFTGYIENKKMPAIYSAADVVVLPSIWDEPAGMTIIEAMAVGSALITTRSGGIPEYVGENGCVLLTRDERLIENIAVAIDKILSNPSYADMLKRTAKMNVSNFTETVYYQQLIHILD